MPTEYSTHARIKLQEAALAEHGYLTNDIVLIPGRLAARINAAHLKFGAHAFTVLVLLSECAIAAPGEYVTTEELVQIIRKSRSRLGELGLSWAEPTAPEVHKAIWQLRAVIEDAGLDDESLVELARHQGYRLNTPAANILIDPSVWISRHPGEGWGSPGGNWPE